jgi:hypothetical protein
MLRQSLAQQQAPFSSLEFIQDNLSIDRTLLLDIVHENHLLYHMEKRDRPNNIIRVLVNLHKFHGEYQLFCYNNMNLIILCYNSHQGTIIYCL